MVVLQAGGSLRVSRFGVLVPFTALPAFGLSPGVGEGAPQDGHEVHDGAAGRQDTRLGSVRRRLKTSEAGFDDLPQGTGTPVLLGLGPEVLGDGVHEGTG